eukprot:s940_g6.t1
MSRCSVRRPHLAVLAAVLSLWVFHAFAFVAGAVTRRAVLVPRRAVGFGAEAQSPSRKRKAVNKEELKADHGAKAEAIEKILRGGAAGSPEDMVRARFSACRSKDSVFMAKTEVDPLKSKLSNRVKAWGICFGTEKGDEYDTEAGDAANLRKVEKLEILEASGNEVEFKIYCAGGTLLERSVMKEDEKWGWVYSGEHVDCESFAEVWIMVTDTGRHSWPGKAFVEIGWQFLQLQSARRQGEVPETAGENWPDEWPLYTEGAATVLSISWLVLLGSSSFLQLLAGPVL